MFCYFNIILDFRFFQRVNKEFFERKKEEKNPSRERKLASKNNLLEFRIFFFFSMKKKKVSVDAFVDQIGYWNYKIMYICEMCTPLQSLPPLKWKMLTAQTLLNILQYKNSAYGRQ